MQSASSLTARMDSLGWVFRVRLVRLGRFFTIEDS